MLYSGVLKPLFRAAADKAFADQQIDQASQTPVLLNGMLTGSYSKRTPL